MGYKVNTPRNTLRKVLGIVKLTSQPLCLYRSECSSWWSIQTHYTTPTLACDPNKLMDAVVQPSGWIIIIFSQINSVNLQMKFKYTIGPCRWSVISVIPEKKPEKKSGFTWIWTQASLVLVGPLQPTELPSLMFGVGHIFEGSPFKWRNLLQIYRFGNHSPNISMSGMSRIV